MKKVLILGNNAAGFLLFRKETLIGLLEAGYDVTVALPDEPQAKRVTELGARLEIVPVNRRGTNPFSDLLLMLRYRALIRRVCPDAVLTYTVKCNVYGGMACRLTRTPYLSTVTGLGSGLNGTGLLQKVTILLCRIGMKGCKALFCQNTSVLEFVQNHRLFSGNLILLPGSGVNLQEHPYHPYPSEEAGVSLCFLGRLMQEKGVGELLLAAKELKARHPHLHLHLAGAPESDEWLQKTEAAAEAGEVIYHGALDDVRDLIRSCHAALIPSYQEGMCNALMESAAAGRALLASDVPGCRELIAPENGLTFAPKSASAIVEAVERFLQLKTEERAAMGRASREKMEREFDRRQVTEQVVGTVRKILK